jgi:hypothetical protein
VDVGTRRRKPPLSQPGTKLTADADRNPLKLVFGVYDIVTAYCEKVRSVKSKWQSMAVPQRMTFLTEYALEVLDALRIPPPGKVGSTLHMGAFEPSTWRIYLAKPLFLDHDWESIAAQAGHVFHEFEHLGATYVAARYLAAGKDLAAGKATKDTIASTLGILAEIAETAASDPLPAELIELGKACHFRVTCEKNPTAPTDYYRSLHANIKKSESELKVAEERLAELGRGLSISPDAYKKAYAHKRLIDKQLAAALREYQLSETELGSNVVENLVKSRLLQKAKAAP